MARPLRTPLPLRTRPLKINIAQKSFRISCCCVNTSICDIKKFGAPTLSQSTWDGPSLRSALSKTFHHAQCHSEYHTFLKSKHVSSLAIRRARLRNAFRERNAPGFLKCTTWLHEPITAPFLFLFLSLVWYHSRMAYHAISHHRSEQQTNTSKRAFLHTWASGVYCFRFYFFLFSLFSYNAWTSHLFAQVSVSTLAEFVDLRRFRRSLSWLHPAVHRWADDRWPPYRRLRGLRPLPA